MFVKLLAVSLIVGVCLAIPVDDSKHPVPVPVLVGGPPHVHGVPPNLPKPDESDLKTDPSTWWHSYYHTYPVYHYNYHSIPSTYAYNWHSHY